MPQAVALALFNAGAPLAVSNALVGASTIGATILTTVATTALVVGGSYAAQRLFAPQTKVDPSRGQVEFQQTKPARFWHYGRNRISGPLALLTNGAYNPNVHAGTQLTKIVLLGCREYDALEEFTLNDEGPYTLDGSGFFHGYEQDGEEHIGVQLHLGAEDQAADADLIAAFPAWTVNHRLRGIPYVIVYQGVAGSDDERPANFMAVYGGNGQKEFRAVMRAAKLYDPRLDTTNGGSGSCRMNDPTTWVWSDNQRLCALDYLTYRDGYNKGFDRIDFASWVAQINMADEPVDLKAGGTEPRYRLAMGVSLDEPKSRVFARIRQAGDQQLFYTAEGLIGSRGGVWEEPTVTLAAEVMPEASFTHGIPSMDRVNEFALSAMLPAHGYVEVDLDPWSVTDDPDYVAGIIRKGDLSLPQVPSHAQAQRLAKIYAMKKNPRWSVQARTDFSGLDLLGQATVTLENDALDNGEGVFNGPFFVDGKIAFLADKSGVSFSASSADPTAYDWNAVLDELDPPPAPGDVTPPATAHALKVSETDWFAASAADYIRAD